MKTIHVVAAIIQRDDKVLIAQRLKGEWAGYWEFPGGKYEPNETGQQAITREIKEELGVDIKVNDLLTTVEYQYPEFYLVMDCYLCELLDDNLQLHDHSQVKWIDPTQKQDKLLPADENVLKNIWQG